MVYHLCILCRAVVLHSTYFIKQNRMVTIHFKKKINMDIVFVSFREMFQSTWIGPGTVVLFY